MIPYENSEQDELKARKERRKRRLRNRIQTPIPSPPKDEPFTNAFPALVETPLVRSRRRQGKGPKRVNSSSPANVDNNEDYPDDFEQNVTHNNYDLNNSNPLKQDHNMQQHRNLELHKNDLSDAGKVAKYELEELKQHKNYLSNDITTKQHHDVQEEEFKMRKNELSNRAAPQQDHDIREEEPKMHNEHYRSDRNPTKDYQCHQDTELLRSRKKKKRRRRIIEHDEVIPSFITAFQGGANSPCVFKERPSRHRGIPKRHSIDAMYSDRRALAISTPMHGDRSAMGHRTPLYREHSELAHGNSTYGDRNTRGHSPMYNNTACNDRSTFGLRSPLEPSAARAFELPQIRDDLLSSYRRRPCKLPPIVRDHRPENM